MAFSQTTLLHSSKTMLTNILHGLQKHGFIVEESGDQTCLSPVQTCVWSAKYDSHTIPTILDSGLYVTYNMSNILVSAQ